MGVNSNKTGKFHLQGISKNYQQGSRTIKVLSDLNLELAEGETVAIIGASGTGKSTLLHLLGGLDRPCHGKFYFKDQDVFSLNNDQLAKFRNKTIGFVFQFHHLLPEFTALENTMMPGLIANINKDKICQHAIDLLTRVGLGKRLDHRIGELSGGEQQRVAIARAIIMEPDLLLADEPTGNLDPETGEMVFDLVRELNRDLGLTTVMVTHNHKLASEMDRCLTLDQGQLQQIQPISS